MINPYAAMEIVSLIYIAIILISLLAKWKKAQTSTKLFALNIGLIMIGTICDVIEISYVDTLPLQLDLMLLYFTCLIGNSLSISFSYYSMFQANSKEHLISVWIPRTVLFVNGLSMAVITVAQFTGRLFVINDGEVYGGAPIYFLFISELLSTAFILVVLIIVRKKIGRRVFMALLVLIVAPTVGLLIEAAVPGVYVSYSSLSISILIQYVLLQSRVVSEAEMRSQIESEVSRTDVMTGLQNRRAYTELLDSIPGPVSCGAMFFDVNGLKITNDTKGHIAGDNLIRDFAGLLRGNLPEAKLFRISGDEFVAIYHGAEKKKIFESDIAVVRDAIDGHDSIASMGVCFEEDGDITKIIAEAERNMYLDKEKYYRKNGHDRRRR